MKAFSWKVACLLLSGWLLCGTSSCTSKSANASTTGSAPAETAALTASSESDDPLTNLKKGNERFYSGNSRHIHQDAETIRELTAGQHPHTVVISCSDSRVPPEIIFDQGLGDIFTIRTAGHVMSDFEEGSVEYAVEHLHSKLVVVLGHEHCGAIHAMLEHLNDDHVEGHIGAIVQALKNEPEEQVLLKGTCDNLPEQAILANIEHGVKQLRESDPILSKLYKEGEINIIGALYHLDNGQVEFLEI
ncbi:MAG: carbonic anhydrase [Tannerellaceae bacterium]|nr:carbonic anhydrase [Tannerellaceae bacterium]